MPKSRSKRQTKRKIEMLPGYSKTIVYDDDDESDEQDLIEDRETADRMEREIEMYESQVKKAKESALRAKVAVEKHIKLANDMEQKMKMYPNPEYDEILKESLDDHKESITEEVEYARHREMNVELQIEYFEKAKIRAMRHRKAVNDLERLILKSRTNKR